MKVTWYPILVSFYASHEIQFREYSTDGGMDDIGYIGSQWVNPNGNANFPVLNENGTAWNSNFNWADNDHNEHWRWLAEVSSSFIPRFARGFLFLSLVSSRRAFFLFHSAVLKAQYIS